jgi:hypothetical protein
MTFPNASTISQTQGLGSAAAVQQTFGLQPAVIQDPTTNVTYITAALLPPISNSPANYQQALSNQLAGQLAKLFQDLFPITADPNYQFNDLTNVSVLMNNQSELLNDVQQIKMTILTINQITAGPLAVAPTVDNRIPTGFTTPNTSTATEAGLSTDTNNNPVLDIVDDLWIQINEGNFGAAQDDYALLRAPLRNYFNL